MSTVTNANPPIIPLSQLQHGQEAICFAALSRKEIGTDRHGNPFVKCVFRDRYVERLAPLWWSNAFREVAANWREGDAFRLHVKGQHLVKYGFQLEIIDARPVVDSDVADGYNYFQLVESSDREPEDLLRNVRAVIDKAIDEPPLRRLVHAIIDEHQSLFMRMPASQSFHHNYTAGLLEHVWSMTRIAGFLAEHYARYYHNLNPPLNKGIIVAGAVLHDIGKLFELDYHPVEAKYTIQGKLIGHVLIGRDMVRETARRLGDVPEETLLLLEHAILAHHGREEFGAPKPPQTLEALILHYIDDLDSKVNAVARQRIKSNGDAPWTDRIVPLNNRQFYRGVPVPPPPLDPTEATHEPPEPRLRLHKDDREPQTNPGPD